MHGHPLFGCPSQPHLHLYVAFFPPQLRGPRIRALPRGYPREVRTLGEHIRKRRLDLGLWQRTLAEQLGVRTETLVTWERGQTRPLARHYGAIVRFLGYDPETAEDTLASRLRAVRRRLGLTQDQLATQAGLDEGSVCRWESGSRRPCSWMSARVEAILEKLEREAAEFGSPDPQPDLRQDLSFFDLTRWRRKPPPPLLPGKFLTMGDRIRLRRLELGLTQEALGKRLGVERTTIHRWERGDAEPPREVEDRLRAWLRGKGTHANR